MVNRRDLMQAILGAGASLVAMVIGKRETSGGMKIGKPTELPAGLSESSTFYVRRKVVMIGGVGAAFDAVVDGWIAAGVDVQTGGLRAGAADRTTVFVNLWAKVRLFDAGDGLALFLDAPCGAGICERLGSLESLKASGVTFILAEGLTIDLT